MSNFDEDYAKAQETVRKAIRKSEGAFQQRLNPSLSDNDYLIRQITYLIDNVRREAKKEKTCVQCGGKLPLEMVPLCAACNNDE